MTVRDPEAWRSRCSTRRIQTADNRLEISMIRKLRALRQSITEEVRVYRLVLGHERTPRLARVFLGAALVYAFSPIDLVPDWLPVIGHLDDVVVVPLLIWLALRMLPTDVVTECRAQVRARSEADDRIAQGGSE